MDILTIVQVLAQKVCAVLSFGVNSVLIHLVLFRSPEGVGMYKYLMVYISVFELIYAFLGLVVQPDFYSYSSVFLVIARTDRLGLPIWIIRIINTMFASMFGMSMAMFTLHFIYRYCVIIRSPFAKMDSTLRISVWFLSPIVYGSIWAGIILTTLGPNESSDRILIETFLQIRNVSINQITYLGPNYYLTDENGVETLNTSVCVGMAIMICMVSTSILTIGIFAYKCYEGVGVLSEESPHSEGYKSLQSQLLNMLVAQVTIPAILMHGPSSVLLTGPFFHIGNEIAGSLFCIAIALYPVLDPLPTLLMIKHYRIVLRTTMRNYLKI